MEIIQQKLIWFLGSGAALILIFKLKLIRIGIRKDRLQKLKAGIIFIFAGSGIGVLLRSVFYDSPISESAFVYFLETIVGYTLGWALILWGLIGWALTYFDLKGKPLSTAGSRFISDIIMKSLLRGDGGRLVFNSIAKEIKPLLDCQAVTFHGIIEKDTLRLAFHDGFTDSSQRLVEYPRGERNVFLIAMKSRQAVISDDKHIIHDFSYPETSKGSISASISIPVCNNGDLLGVLTAYRLRNTPFNEDDLKLLEIAGSGLGASLAKEKTDRKYHLENRLKELLSIVTRPFDEEQQTYSALIKSTKIIRDYIPLKWICLYISGDGKPYSYEFNLPTGGTVKIIEGWFKKSAYPNLYNRNRNTGLKIGANTAGGDDCRTFIFPLGEYEAPCGYLEFELKSPVENIAYMSLLGNMLGQRLALRIKNDKLKLHDIIATNWLGTIEYFQRKAVASKDISSLLKEMASVIIDQMPASFCRIMLADGGRKYLKTVTIAQNRTLNWTNRYKTNMPLSNFDLHRKVLETGETRYFDQSGTVNGMTVDEAARFIPSEIKNGLILPLSMVGKSVGLMTVGDCRDSSRSDYLTTSQSFLAALAGIISQTFSWHKEKRTSLEGARKITMLKKTATGNDQNTNPINNKINSRLNGPLAGIMAACEYLKSGIKIESNDYGKYLGIIEKNASQIHKLTSSK